MAWNWDTNDWDKDAYAERPTPRMQPAQGGGQPEWMEDDLTREEKYTVWERNKAKYQAAYSNVQQSSVGQEGVNQAAVEAKAQAEISKLHEKDLADFRSQKSKYAAEVEKKKAEADKIKTDIAADVAKDRAKNPMKYEMWAAYQEQEKKKKSQENDLFSYLPYTGTKGGVYRKAGKEYGKGEFEGNLPPTQPSKVVREKKELEPTATGAHIRTKDIGIKEQMLDMLNKHEEAARAGNAPPLDDKMSALREDLMSSKLRSEELIGPNKRALELFVEDMEGKDVRDKESADKWVESNKGFLKLKGVDIKKLKKEIDTAFEEGEIDEEGGIDKVIQWFKDKF